MKPALLFDFDNTLSDQAEFRVRYGRALVAELVRRFGDAPAGWGRAATVVLAELEADYDARFVGAPLAGYCDWLEAVRPRTVERLFEAVGLSVPQGDLAALYRALQAEALASSAALFPGAAQTLGHLDASGHALHLASGHESEYLSGALKAAGIRDRFGTLFGPDRIDCAKEGAEYYTRVLEALALRVDQAIVIDDWPPAIHAALSVGLRVVQARISAEYRFDLVAGTLGPMEHFAELPGILEGVGQSEGATRA